MTEAHPTQFGAIRASDCRQFRESEDFKGSTIEEKDQGNVFQRVQAPHAASLLPAFYAF